MEPYFRLLDPEAEAVAFAVERDADRDVDGLLAHDLLVADRDLERVQIDNRVQLLERPALPGAHVVLDRGGHLADQPVRDVDAVQLAQMPLDLAGRHPAGVQGEDLLVEAVEGTRMLRHDPRLKRCVAVARQLDSERPVDRTQRLLGDAVAAVGLFLGRLRRDRHDPAGRTSQIHRNPRTTVASANAPAAGAAHQAGSTRASATSASSNADVSATFTAAALHRSAAHEGRRCVEKPQRRSRTKPRHSASGVRTAAETATTIAAYAGARPHHGSDPGSNAFPMPLQTKAASTPASTARSTAAAQYKGR